jgi:hypothetical protein
LKSYVHLSDTEKPINTELIIFFQLDNIAISDWNDL